MLLIFREETKPQSWMGIDVDKNSMLLTYIFLTSTFHGKILPFLRAPVAD